MNNAGIVKKAKGWYCEKGPDYDVVLAGRIRLSRNLASHTFPGMMKAAEEDAVQERIINVFSEMAAEKGYTPVYLGEIEPTERRVLLERNLLSQDYSLQTQRAVILNEDQTQCALINEIDHMRSSCLHGGLSLKRIYAEIDELDSILEKKLDFAVSLDWGYINTEVTNIGTGMRASVMLHLPALVETALIDRVLKATAQIGLNIKGFFGDDEKSLGDMYQISNQVTLGISEKEIVEKLENITQQIVNYERKVREEMVNKRRIEVEDRVYRAYGLLSHCRTITSKEAIELLLELRFGIALELIDIPMEVVTALLFYTQKAHIQKYMPKDDNDETDTMYIDYMRAKLIQTSIRENTGPMEGKNV